MTDATLTPAQVISKLAELSRDLDTAVRMLKDAEIDAVQKRHAADICESRAFLRAEGSVDARKHQARLDADTQEEAALVAEALVRHLRKQVDALHTRIDIGRSMGVALRADISLTNAGVHG